MEQYFFATNIIREQGIVAYVCDIQTYDLYYMSPKAMQLYGIGDEKDYLHKKCFELFHDFSSPCTFCTVKKLAESRKYCHEYYNKKLGCWIKAEDTLLPVNGRMCQMEVVTDIKAEKEKRLNNIPNISVEQTLVKCLKTLSREKDAKIAINSFLAQIGNYYKSDRVYVIEFDYTKHVVNNTYEWCEEGVSAEIDNLQELPMDIISRWIERFKTFNEFFLYNVAENDELSSIERDILQAQGIKNLMAAPFWRDGDSESSRGELAGFIGVDNATRNCKDITLLRSSVDFIITEIERRQLLANLEYISYTDLLTGLQNRNAYTRMLKEWNEEPMDAVGIIFVDINGMKRINDTHGHKYGDFVIRRTANIMSAHVDAPIFRIGGDEFIILFKNIQREMFDDIILSLHDAFKKDKDCNVSIGSSWKSGDILIEHEIDNADEHMYAEKQSYYRSMFQNGQEVRTGIVGELLQEIKDNKFIIYLQPQVNLKTRKICGAEALIRKKQADGTLIPPRKFIPIYEAEGVIRHLDLFVMETVCHKLSEWKDAFPELRIAVNFSRITLIEKDIVEKLKTICEQHRISPSRITIEVTESIGKIRAEQLQDLVFRIKEAGFSISLDDFGSKYSNLALITALKFNEVKLDRLLVKDLEGNLRSQIVVQNSINMCHKLRDTVSLAEGIEDEEQLAILSKYECDLGQGFLFSKPVSLEQFYTFMQKELSNQDKGNREG